MILNHNSLDNIMSWHQQMSQFLLRILEFDLIAFALLLIELENRWDISFFHQSWFANDIQCKFISYGMRFDMLGQGGSLWQIRKACGYILFHVQVPMIIWRSRVWSWENTTRCEVSLPDLSQVYSSRNFFNHYRGKLL